MLFACATVQKTSARSVLTHTQTLTFLYASSTLQAPCHTKRQGYGLGNQREDASYQI